MTRRSIALLAAAAALTLPAGTADAAPPSKGGIAVLSRRAGLVSGNSALVRVKFTRPSDVKRAKVRVGGRSVRRALKRRGARRLVGVVKRLQPGRNVLRVALPGGGGARVALNDHMIGGPLLSGP